MRHISELQFKRNLNWYEESEKVKEHCKDLPICEVATDGLELIERYEEMVKNQRAIISTEEIKEGLKLILQIIIEKDLRESEKEKPTLEDYALVVLKTYGVKLREMKEKNQVKITITADVDKPTF